VKKIINGILVVILALFIFVLTSWITLVCRIERSVEQIEIEQERGMGGME